MDTPQTKNRLLLVDGDPKSLRVLDVSLKKAGFDVTTASSGHAALASLEAELPDLIISDTDLAEMDGFELCNRIKAKSEWAKIPFLFVSGRKSIEDKIRGLELGVDDYLTKPIYIKEIGVRVRTALQRAERERMESRREGRTRFAGELSELGVVDLVQTIEVNRKSGIIHIVNRDDRRGSIFFRDGKVIDAEVGRLSGAHALYRLFSWSEGNFAVEFKHIRRHDVIDLSMAALLMEGMRRLDESAHLLEHLPSPKSVLEVDCRVLAEELAELPDEMNSVLRLCDGARTLQEIIEESDHPDLETLGIVSKLYLGQIVFAREAAAHGNDSQPGVRLANWLSEGGAEAFAPAGAADDTGDVLPEDSVFPPRAHLPSALEASVTPDETPGTIPQPPASSIGTDANRAGDTLKGIPVETDPADPPATPSAPRATDAAGAADDAKASDRPRSPTPLGLAERLLTDDSVVRAAILHEVLASPDNAPDEPQPAQHHTNPYGSPVTPAAAALLQDVVAATRTSSPPAPVEPLRPTKEVDWGAWPAVAAHDPSVAPRMPTPPVPVRVAPVDDAQGSKAGPSPMDATDFATLEASQAAFRPLATEKVPAPAQADSAVPTALGDIAPLPAAAAPPPAGAGAVIDDEPVSQAGHSPPPTPKIALVPSPNPTHEAALSRAASDAGTRSDASADALQVLREASQPGRLWLLLIAAFGLGVVGVFVLTRGSGSSESEAPPPPPATVATPVQSPSPPTSPTAVPAPSLPVAAEPVPPTKQPVVAVAPEAPAATPPPAEAKHPEPKATGLGTDTVGLRQKCIATDAGGKGRAKAVALACRPALDADPNDADVLVILSRAEIDRGRFGEARALAQRALVADPQRFDAYVYLGTAEQSAGKVEDARAAYKKYLELAPEGPFARELRAILSNL